MAGMQIFAIRLTGHLTEEQLDRSLPSITGTCALVVDAREMTGYDVEARRRFVEWNRQHRQHIRRVAVVTTRILWRAVISAMSLASRQTMEAFQSLETAERWANLD